MGFGSFGIALSLLLDRNGCEVTAWQRSAEKTEAVKKNRESAEYMPGIKIPESINLSSDIKEAAAGAKMIIFAVGSKSIRETSARLKGIVNKSQILINASKGLEPGTSLRLSEVISQVFPDNPVAAISGPCHAEELARGMVSTHVASSVDIDIARQIQDVFMSPYFRVYTNPDIVGVELGGALKNVIALAAGISDGLGFGDNTKAALMTRGIVEISRLGTALGAKAETFSGLAGIGDLIVTCTSMHSRNRRAGILLGQGKSLEETLSEVHMIVEGVNTAKAALDYAKKTGVVMPITEEVNKVLFQGESPRKAVENLMLRQKTSESVLLDM